MKVLSFVAAMKDYFGLLPGTQSVDFLRELRELTPEDKEDFKTMLPSVGYTIV